MHAPENQLDALGRSNRSRCHGGKGVLLEILRSHASHTSKQRGHGSPPLNPPHPHPACLNETAQRRHQIPIPEVWSMLIVALQRLDPRRVTGKRSGHIAVYQVHDPCRFQSANIGHIPDSILLRAVLPVTSSGSRLVTLGRRTYSSRPPCPGRVGRPSKPLQRSCGRTDR